MRNKYLGKRVRRARKRAGKMTRKQIAKALNKRSETKYVQPSTGIQSVYANAVANTGTYWLDLCAGISQGALDYGNRIGDKLTLTSMRLNYTIFYPAGASSYPSSAVRIMIIQYLRSDNSPSSAELLRQSNVVSAGGMYSAYSFRNRDYMSFYHVLYDKRHVVNTNTLAATAVPSSYRIDRSVRISLKKARKVIQYTGGGTQSVNPIFFFAIGDQPTVASNPNLAANAYIQYRDF